MALPEKIRDEIQKSHKRRLELTGTKYAKTFFKSKKFYMSLILLALNEDKDKTRVNFLAKQGYLNILSPDLGKQLTPLEKCFDNTNKW